MSLLVFVGDTQPPPMSMSRSLLSCAIARVCSQARPLLLATGFTLLAGAIGGTFSQLIYKSIKFMAQESVIGVCTSLCFFVSATLFKVQDE